MRVCSLVVAAILVVCLFEGVWGQTTCYTAPAKPQDRRPNKNLLKIAQYNVEWLFLNRNNCPGTGCPWPNQTVATEHIQAVANEIILINADIVSLAEVQDCNVLNTLQTYLNKANMGYLPYLIAGTDTATGQNTALLTRIDPTVNLKRTENRVNYPVSGTKCGNSVSGSTGVSKHYYTYFNVAGLAKPLSIFGAHLLAFPDRTDRCLQREAQAQVLADLVAAEAIAKGHSVVLLGDFNDFDSTVVDASGNKPISQVLATLRDPVKSTPGDELQNVASYIPTAAARYSCWYDPNNNCKADPGEFSLIDHVLVSNDLNKLVAKAWADHSYAPACVTVQSDHWPVIVQLDLTRSSTVEPINIVPIAPAGGNDDVTPSQPTQPPTSSQSQTTLVVLGAALFITVVLLIAGVL